MRRTSFRVLVVSAGVAAVALPTWLAATPALAATSNGCTVNPAKPTFAGFNQSGVKLINYRIFVTCSKGRTVTVQQRRYEEDGFLNPDDFLGESVFSRSFTTQGGSTTINSVRTLVNTELGDEEVYHNVRFRVSGGGVVGPFTSYQKSAVLSISN